MIRNLPYIIKFLFFIFAELIKTRRYAVFVYCPQYFNIFDKTNAFL